MDGAFLQWFNFKKYIYSGREITYVKDDKIRFKGPLTYYHPSNEEHEADNNKTEIFYLDDVNRKVLSYSDFINIGTGENLHQLRQVMKDGPTQCDADHLLDAILKNLCHQKTVLMTLNSETSPENFLRNVSRIELNGSPLRRSRLQATPFTPGGRHEFVFTAHRRLVHGLEHDAGAGDLGSNDGY